MLNQGPAPPDHKRDDPARWIVPHAGPARRDVTVPIASSTLGSWCRDEASRPVCSGGSTLRAGPHPSAD